MAADEPQDQLVIIGPAEQPAELPDLPWAGPLLVIALPVALAVVVFAVLFAG